MVFEHAYRQQNLSSVGKEQKHEEDEDEEEAMEKEEEGTNPRRSATMLPSLLSLLLDFKQNIDGCFVLISSF